jgi:hypothetical protein
MRGPLVTQDSPRIDWETAEVHDAELRVELAGELPKGWRKRFAAVFERLADADEERWGKLDVTKRRIVVPALTDGCEGDLRHQLESALLQANADLGAAADEGSELADEDPERERDEHMTETFRGFAA